jgi:tRNA pseudouridine55 synthase
MRLIHLIQKMNEPQKYKAINGIILVNKPQGITSNKLLQQVKRLFGAKKAGHTGSLDPLATGMLPLCFGEATKICQYLLDADKAYQTTARLGIKTDSGDSTGTIVATVEDFKVTQSQLETVLSEFQGDLKQTPSMFSALKYQGRPLYHFARQGLNIERPARDIRVSELVLNTFEDERFSMTVKVSKGTYIRNLVEDIGESLGVLAHVEQLHRLYTAGFENESMYTLDALLEMTEEERMQCLLPIDRAVNYMPELLLNTEDVQKIRQGKTLQKDALENNSILVRLYSDLSEFIGLGELQADGILKVKRLLSTPPSFTNE